MNNGAPKLTVLHGTNSHLCHAFDYRTYRQINKSLLYNEKACKTKDFPLQCSWFHKQKPEFRFSGETVLATVARIVLIVTVDRATGL